MLDFSFFQQPAGFSLSESALTLSLYSPLWQTLAAGLLNTLRVALPALVFSLMLGAVLGLAQLSPVREISGTARMLVQLVRNVPMLLQLLAVYFVWIKLLPEAHQAWQFTDMVYVSKSGIALPWLEQGALQLPQQGRFAVLGGVSLSAEYLALLLTLVLYTAAYMAEVVRAGVLSVPVGQVQSGLALGLSPAQNRRLVVWPMALRLMVPPLTNQAINLLKNASLGVAIGYPEVVSVSNTAMNQSGRVVECVLVVLVVYGLMCLCTGLLAQRLNPRWQA